MGIAFSDVGVREWIKMSEQLESLKPGTTGLHAQLAKDLEQTIFNSLPLTLWRLSAREGISFELAALKATLEREANTSFPADAMMVLSWLPEAVSLMTSHPGWQSWLTIGAELISALLLKANHQTIIPPSSIGISAKLTIQPSPDFPESAKPEPVGAALQLTLEAEPRPSSPAPMTSTPSPRATTSPEPGDGKSS